MCANCNGAVAYTGICIDCGTAEKRTDMIALVVGAIGLLMLPLPWLVEWVLVSVIGINGMNVLLIISGLLPLSMTIDAVVLAVKRKDTHKTKAALFVGIIGTLAGIFLLLCRTI